MNPEFERNLWLELTPRRMIVMASVVALALFVAGMAERSLSGPGAVAQWLFIAIVVFWGSWKAAYSVVGEIRDRTWDSQRMSALSPAQMVFGKLFGATSLTWFGGAICVAVIAAAQMENGDMLGALGGAVKAVMVGITVQAAALLASLIAIRRGGGRARFDVFVCQAAGIIAALALWQIAGPSGLLISRVYAGSDAVVWWGILLPSSGFVTASTMFFAAWMVTGCYRLMRLELKLANRPFVWLVFLVTAAAYFAGFDVWGGLAPDDAVTRGLYGAGLVLSIATYAAALLEPKSLDGLRRMGADFAAFRLGAALKGLPGWAMAWLLTLAIGIAMLVRLGPEQAVMGAMTGFFTRDMGIIVLAGVLAPRRGGDFLAMALLAVLYALLPGIVSGLHYAAGQALFVPHVTDPAWLSPLAAWAEAVMVWAVAIARLTRPKPV